MPLYVNGKYDSTVNEAYAFAYNGVMDELAEHNEYNNSQTFKALKKLSTLTKEEVEIAKGNEASKYAFVIVEKIDNNMIAKEVTMDIEKNLALMSASTTYTLSKTKIGATNYFDGANNYIISADNESVLKTPKVTVWDSNETATKSRKNISLDNFKTGSKTSIIENLKLDLDDALTTKLDSNALSKMKQKVLQEKSFGDCSADIHVYYDGDWELKGRADNVAFRSALNLRAILPSEFEKARAIRINWDVGGVTIYKTFFFYDPDGIYSRGIVASATAQETNYISNMTYDNNFKNEYEYKDGTKWTEPWTPTHTIIELDKVLQNGMGGNKTLAWKNSDYAGFGAWWAENPSQDTRKPLLLIHGWQAPSEDEGRNPAIIRDYEHNEFEYWHNFISYYLSTPDLYNKFKLYTYHYPSYKHITFNGKILANLLDSVRGQNNVLGQGLDEYDGLTIVAHSMGGLVARSTIEEHNGLGYSAERLAKLITLDTPHRGSHGANQAHLASDFTDYIGVKDLGTPGAIDLIWDNYDYYYSRYSGKESKLYKETVSKDPSENDSRYNILKDKGRFDNHYINKLNNSFSTNEYDAVNPYLAYLNKNFVSNWVHTVNSLNENKYIFYVGHVSGNLLGKSKITNPIDTPWAFIASTRTFNYFGYGSAGGEPVCSAFLTKETDPTDEETRFSGDFETPTEFIVTNDDGVENNYNIAYRYFWDYEHESMMSGRAKERGSWDRFVDNKNPISSSDCSYTNYHDFVSGSGCGTQHYNYYLYAFNFLYGTDYSINQNQIYTELANPLTTEPVFMILQKDLTDIN
jgi:pimeloyl-ACP methyl ester carboxylesterase